MEPVHTYGGGIARGGGGCDHVANLKVVKSSRVLAPFLDSTLTQEVALAALRLCQ